MIKTPITLCFETVIRLGGAPLLELLVPFEYQYMRLLLWIGNLIIMKEFTTLGMRLIVVYFDARKDRLAQESSTLAMNILQEAIRGKSGGKQRETMMRTVANCFIHGLNRAAQKGHVDKVNSILDYRMTLFEHALESNDKLNAISLSEVVMTLLVAAIEEAVTERGHSSITDRLLRSWVTTLDHAAAARRPLVQTVLNNRANDINESIRRGNVTCIALPKAWMEMLKVAILERRVDVSKMMSKFMAKALDQAISEGHREIVDSVLHEAAAEVFHAIREGNETETKAISDVRQELMMAASDRKAKQLVVILSESWLIELDRAACEGYSEAVYGLINARATTFYEAIRDDSTKANPIWEVSTEVLLTAIRLEKVELVKRLSMSFVNALAEARTRFDEGLVDSLVYHSITVFGGVINSHDNDRANMVSKAGLELLLAAVNLGEPLLVKDLSHASIVALDVVGDGRYQETVESLIGARTKAFEKAMIEGNGEEVRMLSTVGLELLLAAIRGGKEAITRSLSRTWVIALADAIDKGHKQTVDSLVNTQTEVFREAIIRDDLNEVGTLTTAAVELCLTAIKEDKPALVESLSGFWARALAAGIGENRDMAEMLVRRIRQRFDTAIGAGNKEEMDMLSIAAQKTLQSANDSRNPAVARLVERTEAWGPLLERLE